MELGIRARNFWHQGLDAFFDIRTDTNALSYKDLSIDTIFRKHESEKKREFNQRGMEYEHLYSLHP